MTHGSRCPCYPCFAYNTAPSLPGSTYAAILAAEAALQRGEVLYITTNEATRNAYISEIGYHPNLTITTHSEATA